MKKCTRNCEKTENSVFGTKFGYFGAPWGSKKASLNPFVFLFAQPIKTYKLKMVMIHEEMHPELRKNRKCD